MDNKKADIQVNTSESIDQILEKESSFAPLVDIYETTDEFVLIANLPGVDKENVILKYEEGSLSILGRVDYNNAIDRKYLLNENEIGNYYRKFRISNSIDESKIQAKYENGQLVINLPKHERVKPKNIQIK